MRRERTPASRRESRKAGAAIGRASRTGEGSTRSASGHATSPRRSCEPGSPRPRSRRRGAAGRGRSC
eukprot:9736639-Heterocapsa_arctica.AAC.1